MWKKELAYAKQGVLSVRSWDSFQCLLRRGLKIRRLGNISGAVRMVK